MNYSDFSGEDFQKMDSTKLSEWVLDGEHHPEVEIYHNKETNEGYQVTRKHKLFRKTEVTSDLYKIQKYGEWEKLSE